MQTVATAIAEFHQRFAQNQDALIDREADPEWRAAGTEQSRAEYFDRIRQKMGTCSYHGPIGATIKSTTAGTFATMRYTGTCEKGALNEVFRWHIVDGRAYLLSYNASSSF